MSGKSTALLFFDVLSSVWQGYTICTLKLTVTIALSLATTDSEQIV